MNVVSQLKSEITLSLRGGVADVTVSNLAVLDFDVTKSQFSDYQTNIALVGAKIVGKNPRELAGELILLLKNIDFVENMEVAGPGFINIELKKDWICEQAILGLCEESLSTKKSYNNKIFIDYGGANVAKPMHVGHLRSCIIGDCIARVYRYLGYEVVTDIHLGDWGTQMGMLIVAISRMYPELPYFNPDFEGEYPLESPVTVLELSEIYPKISAECKENPETKKEALQATLELQNGRHGYRSLWKHFVEVSVESLKEDLSKLNIDFDLWLGESDAHESVSKVLDIITKKGLLVESDGAGVVHFPEKDVEVDGEKVHFKELPTAVFRKNDGASLYSSTDLATIYNRVEKYHPDKIVYVADMRQSLHFAQVFRVAKESGIASVNLELFNAGFGTVNGSDGKPFKTREGGVMKLGELIDLVISKAQEKMDLAGVAKDYQEEEKKDIAQKVGIAALKFADLINNRQSDYIFDLDKFCAFEGKTGPYLVYSAVRIKSIYRKNEILRETIKGYSFKINDKMERELVLACLSFDDILQNTLSEYTPNTIAEYLYNLAQQFNHFYQLCNIQNQADLEQKQSWLMICELVLKTLEDGLGLLGIEVSERM